MNTNHYFIEYLVAGTLTIIWGFILFLGFAGIKWLELIAFKDSFVLKGDNLLSIIVIFFPVVYVIGIITDRLVDQIFELFFTPKKLSKYFKDRREYDMDVTKLFLTSVELSQIYNSTHMRIRIVRTATFSALMTFISLQLFFWNSGIYDHPEILGLKLSPEDFVIWKKDIVVLAVMLSIFMIIAAYTSFRAWNLLLDSEYTRLRTRVQCIDELKEEKEGMRQ